MTSIRSALVGVLLAGATTISGCGEPLGPAELAGDFVLTHVGGTPIPGTIRLDNRLDYRVVYDSVTLRADGTARTSHRGETRESTGAVTAHVNTMEWVYEIQSPIGRIKLSQPPCRIGTLCGLVLTRPRYFAMRGRDLVRETDGATPSAMWSRSE